MRRRSTEVPGRSTPAATATATATETRTGPLTRAVARQWVAAWDRQQALYIPERERRFSVMFDAIESYLPPSFVALDVGCGPGSLSQRLLARFPQARVVALDLDPVLMQLGRRAQLVDPARTRWVESDLRDPNWTRALPEGRFDAILSTTALHWLSPTDLVRTYRVLHDLLRPGGLFLNGDSYPYGKGRPIFRHIAHATAQRWQYQRVREGDMDWGAWWAKLEQREDLRTLFELRRRRFPKGEHHETTATVDEQESLLRAAGFLEPTIVWRDFSNGVMMAVRGDGRGARSKRRARPPK